MTNGQLCIDIREQRRNIDIELSRYVLSRRRNVTERRVILVEKFVIETLAHNFAGPLFDFTDVDEHSIAWVDRSGKNKICYVIAAGTVASIGLRAEGSQVFAVTPTTNAQTPRCRELETFADRQQHDGS
jgi:hypothetical protein